MDEQGLGRQLQAARRQSGLTQQELCNKANLSYSTLAKIERGAIKSPSIFTIQNIASALNVSLDELIGTAGPKKAKNRSRSGVSFIYFDVNGCLVRFYQRATAQIAEDYGLSPDLVETAYLHYNDDVCRGTMTLEDFNQAMADRLHLKDLDWAKYYLAATDPLTEMHEVITWAAEHYRVGLLTNIMPGLLEQLMKLGKVPRLPYDVVVDSSQIGAIKPEAAIYEYAQKEAGVAPEEILLVDDTHGNVLAAEKQGWRAIWFDYARPEGSAKHIREALVPAS